MGGTMGSSSIIKQKPIKGLPQVGGLHFLYTILEGLDRSLGQTIRRGVVGGGQGMCNAIKSAKLLELLANKTRPMGQIMHYLTQYYGADHDWQIEILIGLL